MTRRVLYVEGCRDGTVGGSHICLHRMLAGLNRNRFKPTAVFYADHHIAEALRAMDVHVEILPGEAPLHLASRSGTGAVAGAVAMAMLPAQKLANFARCLLHPAMAHARYIRRRKFDVVHLNNSINGNHEWMLAARLARVRIVSHERGCADSMPRTSRMMTRWIDRHVCASRQIQDTLVRDGVAMARTTVVYDGIDVGQMRPDRDPEVVRSAYGIPRGAPVIGIVGGVKRWKGQHVVVRATAKLAAMWPDVRCLVVGSGVPGETYFEELLQLSRDLGLERNVIFTGFEPRPADLMNAMDVVVHASITPEPFGLVNIEAMALRKPVVATRIGGPIEIFDDGRDGLLVAPSDPAALAERLATLLADPVLRRRIGESARTKVEEKFTMSDTVRAIESVYDEVCQ